jgi:hypothetical protein
LITHFSEYMGGSPTPEEASSQAEAAGEVGGSFPEQWRDRAEGTGALNDWGNGLNSMGMGDEGNAAANQARERLINDLECLMNIDCAPPYPLDPCGDYLQMLMQYFTQANLLASTWISQMGSSPLARGSAQPMHQPLLARVLPQTESQPDGLRAGYESNGAGDLYRPDIRRVRAG